MYTVLLFTFCLVSIQAQSDTKPLISDWKGTLDAQGTKLNIIFHIRLNEGKLQATMDSPDQNAFALKFDEAKYEDGTLTLKMSAIQGNYTGKLVEGELKGIWKQGPAELTLNMKKIKSS